MVTFSLRMSSLILILYPAAYSRGKPRGIKPYRLRLIIYSNKKKEDLIFPNINKNQDISEITEKTFVNKYHNFIGKNYKDILIENNLSQYIELFEKNNLTDIIIISELNETDYEKIGINTMGDRKKIIKIFRVY